MATHGGLRGLSDPRFLGITTVRAGTERRVGEPSAVTLVSTFLIHLWEEWSAAGSRWRRRIEQVQSGESATFFDFEGLLNFVPLFAA